MPAKSKASSRRSIDPCAELKRQLRDREAELEKAREQQAVTSELLRIISSFPSSPQPVFDAIVKSAAHLFGGLDVSLRLVVGDQLEVMATTLPQKHTGRLTRPVNDEAYPTTRSILRRELIVVADVLTEEWVSEAAKERARHAGFRGFICVPMLKEDVVIGVINVLRSTPGPFSEDQIALVKTFADHAVIAIENVRLSKELQARNAELAESLATARCSLCAPPGGYRAIRFGDRLQGKGDREFGMDSSGFEAGNRLARPDQEWHAERRSVEPRCSGSTGITGWKASALLLHLSRQSDSLRVDQHRLANRVREGEAHEPALPRLAAYLGVMASASGDPCDELKDLGGWKSRVMVDRYAKFGTEHLAVAAARIEAKPLAPMPSNDGATIVVTAKQKKG